MTIHGFWLNRAKYSLAETAYLVCGLEPQNKNADYPQIVSSVYHEIKSYLLKNHPELQGRPIRDVWFEIDDVRDWADHIGITDFFKQESKNTSKPLHESERKTLLKLVLGMAIDKYSYDPKDTRNTATGDKNGISAKLQAHGISVSDESIRKYLNEAKELL